MADVLDGGGIVLEPSGPSDPLYGVTVQHVRELATHIGRRVQTDTDFGNSRPAEITDDQILSWINLVADTVNSRLLALRRYSADTGLWAGIVGSARTAITNGAAAYLVSAAYPAKAGTNEQTSYSAELTARYEREIQFLMELPVVLADPVTTTPLPGQPDPARVPLRGNAPRPAAIPDDSTLFHHTRTLYPYPRRNQDVYTRPPAPGAEEGYR